MTSDSWIDGSHCLRFFQILEFKREKLSSQSWPNGRAAVPVAIDFNAGAPANGKRLMRALVDAGCIGFGGGCIAGVVYADYHCHDVSS